VEAGKGRQATGDLLLLRQRQPQRRSWTTCPVPVAAEVTQPMCPVVLDTPAALAASRSVAPDARALHNRARTSADFGRLPPPPRVIRNPVMITDVAMIG
jgi:hypothetical protein